MNKGELVLKIQKELGKETSKAAAERSLDAVLFAIVDGLKKDGEVALVGFGTFRVAKRASRKGINPQTRQPINIKASKTVKFKPGQGLKTTIK